MASFEEEKARSDAFMRSIGMDVDWWNKRPVLGTPPPDAPIDPQALRDTQQYYSQTGLTPPDETVARQQQYAQFQKEQPEYAGVKIGDYRSPSQIAAGDVPAGYVPPDPDLGWLPGRGPSSWTPPKPTEPTEPTAEMQKMQAEWAGRPGADAMQGMTRMPPPPSPPGPGGMMPPSFAPPIPSFAPPAPASRPSPSSAAPPSFAGPPPRQEMDSGIDPLQLAAFLRRSPIDDQGGGM